MPNHDTSLPVSSLVPTELVVQVLVGQLDEQVAIERGQRAAQAENDQERRRILFDGQVPAAPRPETPRAPCWRPLNPPWGEP